jgi:hypothetical protein
VPDGHTAGVRSDPGFTRSRRARHNRRVEVPESTSIATGFSTVNSIGSALPRKSDKSDTRPTGSRLGTVSRVKSSARAGHLTASRLSSRPLVLPALSPSLAFALAGLDARSARRGSHKSAELCRSPTHDSGGDRAPALTRPARQGRARTTAILSTGSRVG